jgi:hypothetical protein
MIEQHKKDLWHKLEMRLRSIAQGNWSDNRNDDIGQCCLMKITLLYSEERELIGWQRPEIVLLEPRDVKPVCQRVQGWQQVIEHLRVRQGQALILQRGQPVGWLP